MDHMDDKLDALWREYREACPDPEPSAQFMPGLWRRIDGRRRATASVRRLAQIFVTATVALTLLIGVVLIPRSRDQATYNSATYVDVLAAEQPDDYAEVFDDIEDL